LRNTWAALARISVEVKATDALLREPITETLSKFLAAQYAIAVDAAVQNAASAPLKLRTLAALTSDGAALRKGDQNAAWLRLERHRVGLEYRRLGLARKNSHERWKSDLTRAMEAFNSYLADHPQARAAFDAFALQVRGPFGNPVSTSPKPVNPTQSDPIRPLKPA